MLNQILIHTPMYVWAILACLVWRGMVEMRERELPLPRLFVLPLAMLGLALYDVVAKFGMGAVTMAAWMAGCAASLLLVWKFGSTRIVAGAAPGSARLRGSKAPLAVMMALFLVKYASSVFLVIQPQAGRDALVAAAVCATFGVFSGWFLGRLAHDLSALRTLSKNRGASACPPGSAVQALRQACRTIPSSTT